MQRRQHLGFELRTVQVIHRLSRAVKVFADLPPGFFFECVAVCFRKTHLVQAGIFYGGFFYGGRNVRVGGIPGNGVEITDDHFGIIGFFLRFFKRFPGVYQSVFVCQSDVFGGDFAVFSGDFFLEGYHEFFVFRPFGIGLGGFGGERRGVHRIGHDVRFGNGAVIVNYLYLHLVEVHFLPDVTTGRNGRKVEEGVEIIQGRLRETQFFYSALFGFADFAGKIVPFQLRGEIFHGSHDGIVNGVYRRIPFGISQNVFRFHRRAFSE